MGGHELYDIMRENLKRSMPNRVYRPKQANLKIITKEPVAPGSEEFKEFCNMLAKEAKNSKRCVCL